MEFTIIQEDPPWPERARWMAISPELANIKEMRWREDRKRREVLASPSLTRDEERRYVLMSKAAQAGWFVSR